MNLLEKIKNAGVVGAGGAGFPTDVKLNSKVEYFIINAAECEPFLCTDKYLLQHHCDEVLKAVYECALHLSAKFTYIAIKETNHEEIAILKAALTRNKWPIELFYLRNYYPAGDEQMMVYDVTKRVVPEAGIPLEVSTVVCNVATMFHVYESLSDQAVILKYLSVIGCVKNPSLLELPIGSSVKECIDLCGGLSSEAKKIILGGPMMGKVYDINELEQLYVTKTCSSILVVDDENKIAAMKDTSMPSIINRAKSACIQCRACTDLCPRHLVGHNLNPHAIMRQLSCVTADELEEHPWENYETAKQALICSECGVCEYYACPMGLSPRTVNMYIKNKLMAKQIRYPKKTKNYEVSQFRKYRKINPKSIMARVGLSEMYQQKVSEVKKAEFSSVCLSLKQHIGAPSVPCIADGEFVKVGQLIATCPEKSLGANLHASISGVATLSKNEIIIKKEKE